MVSLCLNSLEKSVTPKLNLHNSIKELNEYEKNLGKKIRSDKTFIKNKLKEKETKFKKEFEKTIKESREIKEPKIKKSKSLFLKVNNETCTIVHLGRILNCLEDIEYAKNPLTINDVIDFTMLSSKVVEDGLNFLSKRGIIKEIKDRGLITYTKISL